MSATNLRNNTARSASTSSARASTPLPIEEAFYGLLKQRKLLVTSALLSLLAGFGVMLALQKSKHSYEGSLLYTPNHITAPYYTPPALNNLLQVVNSPVLLGKLKEELDLDDSLSDLKRSVRFELAPGGDSVEVSTVHSNADSAATINNRAMQLFVSKASKIRQQSLEGFVQKFEADLALGVGGVDQAKSQLQEWMDTNGLESYEGLKSAMAASQLAVADLDMELEMGRIELASARAKHERLMATQKEQVRRKSTPQEGDEKMADIPGLNAPSHNAPSLNALAGASGSDLRLFLREQISEEQRTSAYAVKLQVKDREYKRAKSLHARELISDADLERIEGERAILRAEKNARVAKLQSQLGRIEQKMTKDFNEPSILAGGNHLMLVGFSEEPRLLRQSIAMLELEILGAEHKVERLARKLKVVREGLVQSGRTQKEIEPLLEGVRLATAERDRLQHLVEEFRQTQRSKTAEIKVVQPATPVIDGVRSNAPKLFAGTFLGALGLLIGPVFFREWQKQTGQTQDV